MAEPEKRGRRIMKAKLLSYDLQEIAERLKSEAVWKKSGRNSITLNMGDGLRAAVVALHKGSQIKTHKAEHPISVQTVEGEIEFAAAAGTVHLKAGQLLVLGRKIPHSVKAVEESVFLLTFGV